MKEFEKLRTDPPKRPGSGDDKYMLASAAVLKEQRDMLLQAASRVLVALNNTDGLSGQKWIQERKDAFNHLRDTVNEVEGK